MGYVLDPAIRQIMINAVSDGIQQFGKSCRLVFPTNQTVCPNCIISPNQGRSMNIYKSGGPVPFGQGNICPVCGGRGLIMSPERTQVITMIVRWNPSDFTFLPQTNIEMPYSVCETTGYLSDVSTVKQARVMIAETPLEPLIRARFELSGEPVEPYSIAQDNYFVCHWKRKG